MKKPSYPLILGSLSSYLLAPFYLMKKFAIATLRVLCGNAEAE
jgi:hypothetical protein